jgi:hypothetical protein
MISQTIEARNCPGSWPALTYNDHYVIWGLTHRILAQLWNLISA